VGPNIRQQSQKSTCYGHDWRGRKCIAFYWWDIATHASWCGWCGLADSSLQCSRCKLVQ
jgi:hypothetical protein